MRAILLVLLCSLLPTVQGLAQEIRARVLDEPTRQPLAGVTITLMAGQSVLTRVVTDASGFFRLKPGRAGEYVLRIEMLSYAPVQQDVSFADKEQVLPAFLLTPVAVPLAPVEAQGRREQVAGTAVGFSRASHVISGSRLALLEQQSARPLTLVREIGGLSVTEYATRTGQTVVCVQARRRMGSIRQAQVQCDWPVIVIDGVRVADRCDPPVETCVPYRTFRELNLRDMESFEYLSPVEAGHQYGMEAGANGAMVIWTRGRGPHKSAARDSVR